MSNDPLWYRWNGIAMLPMRAEIAAQQFRPDGRYLLEAHHERTWLRHKAYFAAVHDAWSSLQSDKFPSPEHLRKYALIQTGWYDERVLACDGAAMAAKVAAFVQPFNEFSVVVVEDSLVRVLTPRSQRYKAMGRDQFNKSMDDVLDYCAALVDVQRDELEAQGGAA